MIVIYCIFVKTTVYAKKIYERLSSAMCYYSNRIALPILWSRTKDYVVFRDTAIRIWLVGSRGAVVVYWVVALTLWVRVTSVL